jgi:putative PIN family toxin of toxin-antitoxin system
MRVVLDTNVLISAFLFGGIPRGILHSCLQGEPRLVISDAILDELQGVLRRERFGLPADRVRAIVYDVTTIGDVVTTTSTVTVISEDPSDNAVLECALDGKADDIVSGDKHLLDLENYRGIGIMDPRRFMDSQLRQG